MLEKQADVVIVGYGGAGAVAAITAHDAGAEVTILEKTQDGGGNTRCSGGSIRQFFDPEKAATYFHAVSDGTVGQDLYRAFTEESNKTPDWISQLGGQLEKRQTAGFPPKPRVAFPDAPGAEGIGDRWQVRGSTGGLGGATLWDLLCHNVMHRGIRVLYDSPAKRIVRNESGEVTGIVADSPDGELRIESRRAVILTCGGFEYSADMQTKYLGIKLHAVGNPSNTGDGIRMAEEIGADLWHMNAFSSSLGYKVPGYKTPFQHRMRTGGYIYVDQNGNRFIDEVGTDGHVMAQSFCQLDRKVVANPRNPSFVIFDESTRRSGPIASDVGWSIHFYKWSRDNSAEIRSGWIVMASDIKDLATKLSVRPERLEETVTRYNAFCSEGRDPDFGRAKETLSPIASPPFYAMPVVPCLVNTQGGPRRNAGAQVLDRTGNPIRRLYSAGELGSVWSAVYPGAGNITECLSFGRIAGRNAAAEPPLFGH